MKSDEITIKNMIIHRASVPMFIIILSSLILSSPIQGFTFQKSFVHNSHYSHPIQAATRTSRPALLSLGSSKRDSIGDESSTATATSGKGFGKNTLPKTKSTKSLNDEETSQSTLSTTTTTIQDSVSSTTKISAGKEALERLRQADVQKRNEEFKSMQQLQQIDSYLKEDPSLGVIPEKVATRMGKRMLPFVGLPLFGSMLTFVLFWYLARYKDFSIPTVLVAYATSAILIVGLMGITYSVMSASWDADREGSLVGWEEFQINVNNVKEGLQRSRENAVLRDRLSTLSEDEKKKLESNTF